MIFRFDDICINSDMEAANKIAERLREKFERCTIVYAVSPIVCEGVGERVFPKVFSAMSDYRNFYQADKLGLPDIPDYALIASHGLVHADHRLLTREAQEMSILISCSLLRSHSFVPPFNKWDKGTEQICDEHNINLIKFEDGWLSMEHNAFKDGHYKWYLHHRDFDIDKLNEWLK